jgi:hypothetical protein
VDSGIPFLSLSSEYMDIIKVWFEKGFFLFLVASARLFGDRERRRETPARFAR